MSETVYNVGIRYTVDARGGRVGTQELKGDVRQLERANRDAASSFGLLGAAATAGLAVVLGHAAKALVGFNANVQNAKIGLSAMLQGNLGGTWEQATENAQKLYLEFQKFSTETPVTTQEILTFGKAVAVATFQAGGSIKDMTTITEKGVIAAKAFGYESAYTALEISEMLSGNVSVRMMFAKQMLGMAHVTMEEFRQMGAGKRLQLVRATLDSEAMKNAQNEFATSWTGVTSTLEDKLQIGLGAVGLPLFKAATAEIQRWNVWLSANEHKVANIAHSIGDGIAKGFGVMKDAVGFLVEHREALMTMGKIWLAVKVAGVLGGRATEGGTNLASRGSSLMAWGRGARDSYDENGNYVYQSAGAGRQNVGMKGALANAGLLAQSLALGYAFGSLINDATGLSTRIADLALDKTSRQFDLLTKESDALTLSFERTADANPKQATVLTGIMASAANDRQIADLAAAAARAPMRRDREGNEFPSDLKLSKLDALEKLGIGGDEITKAGGLKAFAEMMADRAGQLDAKQASLATFGPMAFNTALAELTDYQKQTLDSNKGLNDVLAYMNQNGIRFMFTSEQRSAIVDIMRKATEDPTGKHNALADKPNVNVHIARIEVQSDDPDRIAFGLIEQFRDAAKNPSSAFHAIREG
jgi:hypothetical protein